MKKSTTAIIIIIVLGLGVYAYMQKSNTGSAENDKKEITAFVTAFKYFDFYAASYYNMRAEVSEQTVPQIKIMKNDLAKIDSEKTAKGKAAAAEEGLRAANAMVLISENDPTFASTTKNLNDLTVAAKAIGNKKVRDQAMNVANLSSEELKNAAAYQAAFKKKYQLIADMFSAVVQAKGNLNDSSVVSAEANFGPASQQIATELNAAANLTRTNLTKLPGEYATFVSTAKAEQLGVADMDLTANQK